MSWNHRILAHEGVETYLQLHEVYYDKEGIPYTYTSEGVTVGGDSLSDLYSEIQRIQECLKKPTLWAGDRFPEEYKETL
jgi:hypothetical protein